MRNHGEKGKRQKGKEREDGGGGEGLRRGGRNREGKGNQITALIPESFLVSDPSPYKASSASPGVHKTVL